MAEVQTLANPFDLMMNPQAVLQALEASERLGRLESRVYRPLDKPLIPKKGSEIDAFDEDVDLAGDDA